MFRFFKPFFAKVLSKLGFQPKATLTISARVYRHKTGKWENLGTIAKGKVTIKPNVQ